MSTSQYFIFVALVACVLVGCSGSPTSGSPKAVVERFNQAIQAGDETAAKSVFTADAWEREVDPGKRLYEQATRKKFTLQPKEPRIQDTRAVVEADAIIDGKVKDTLYFYAVHEGAEWRLAAFDENARHGDHYLAGRLPAHFHLKSMPSSPEMAGLGQKVLEWLSKPLPKMGDLDAMPEEQKKALFVGLAHAPKASTCHMLWSIQAEIPNPRVVSTHWVEGLSRSAVAIAKQGEKHGGYTLYFEKKDGDWHLLGMTTIPSSESILGDFK